MTALSILTINAWHGYTMRGVKRMFLEPHERRARRKQALMAGIARLAPDVIFMQECLPEPDYAQSIADALDYDVINQEANSGIRVGNLGFPLGGRDGIAIFAARRLGLRKLSARRLCGFGFNGRRVAFQLDELNYALVGEIALAGQRVILICTHVLYTFPDMPTLEACWGRLRERGTVDRPLPAALAWRIRHRMAGRARSLRRLSSLIARLGEHTPAIVGGDFNLEDEAPSMRSLLGRLGLTNAARGRISSPTWDPAGNANVAFSTGLSEPDEPPSSMTGSPAGLALSVYDTYPQRPDHILVSERSFGVEHARVVLEPEAEADDRFCPSDHYGIHADVRLIGRGTIRRPR